MTSRAELVADAAIALLVDRGMRGLTHRAVDEAAGLAPGSTSNIARTRLALLELAMTRLTGLDDSALLAGLSVPSRLTREQLTEIVANALNIELTTARRRALARYELALEANRRPELREIYDRAGRRFREPLVALVAAAGSPDPARHARQLVAFHEGVLFDALAGAGDTPSLDDLRRSTADFLAGILP
ncbi:TetR/AcrR family transcriptional regulator [Actinomadura rupiterrae]|uniref:TetR/AcrR family transcriptional regulator n=1 Tax=Actinomadura rupiterrae TaxID=559627 RepID=UPI0020A60B30|nr:TetR/AcrR family transcriptional regulator [Actinomadura rupiterrae]MCP2340731.1 DNA-binding transcriptional regulator YbjK [Actinomadura rupiterrae]